ncbi:hypothetical protein [Reichenbachiella sp.]|uniref:hypothetical protein n=1 Tax=Reichenbachiella sp. TaxID=2184521 RepID=UPI003BB0F1B9
MNITISTNRNLLYFGVPLALFAVVAFFVQSITLKNIDALSLAITADLLITIPLVYFLLIRNSSISKITVIPMMILGLVLGGYLLPKENQNYLDLFKTWALPVIELTVMTFVVIKVRMAIKGFKRLKSGSADFFTILKKTCAEFLPKRLVLPFATEVAVIYYGFIRWKSHKPAENEFTYHKTSGTPALFGAVIFVIGIETLALHILLEGWNQWVAWILSILSVYTALQVFGFAKSLGQRPIVFDTDSLILHYGILNEVKIPFEHIDSIELSGKSIDRLPMAKTLSPIGDLEGHNVILYLKEESTLSGLYGLKQRFKILALYVDNKNEFVSKLAAYCDNQDKD